MKYFFLGIFVLGLFILIVNAPELLILVGLVAGIYFLGRLVFAPKEQKIPKSIRSAATPLKSTSQVVSSTGKQLFKSTAKTLIKSYKDSKERSQKLSELEQKQHTEKEAKDLEKKLRSKAEQKQ